MSMFSGTNMFAIVLSTIISLKCGHLNSSQTIYHLILFTENNILCEIALNLWNYETNINSFSKSFDENQTFLGKRYSSKYVQRGGLDWNPCHWNLEPPPCGSSWFLENFSGLNF